MELSAFLNQKKKIILAAVVIFIVFVFFLLLNAKKERLIQKEPKETSKTQLPGTLPTSFPQTAKRRPTTFSPPATFFESYENKTNLPTIPQTINQYTFKSKFSLEQVRSLAAKLGLTELKQLGDDYVLVYNLHHPQNKGLLTFNLVSGGFTFESYGAHQPPITNASPAVAAFSFLKNLGVVDDTVTCPITYQKQAIDNVTFVECHRDWGKAGAPILSFVGSLNVPEDQPLSQLAVGKTDKTTPTDSSIINVSTGENGKARPNDFNSITVAVSSENNIIFVDSNLRPIEKITPLLAKDLVTPQEALNQFMANQANLSFSSPRGSGAVDLTKVYPQNQARAKKAFITDYLLVYLEKPPDSKQEKLSPMYFIRGVAELESGYTIQFIKTLPATKGNYLSSVLGTTSSLYSEVAFPTYPAGKTNPLGTDRPHSESWRCLKAESYQGEIQPGGKTDHLLRLTGEGLTPQTKLYFIGCVSKADGATKCTTGDLLVDLQLKLINNMAEKDPNFEFIVDPENPINLTSNKAEKIVYSHSTDKNDVQSFYGLMILPPELLSEGKGDSIQYGSFKFKQDVSKCTALRWTEPSPTPIPTTPPATQPPLVSPTPGECCVPSTSQLDPIYEVDGVKFGKNTISPRKGDWYYIPPAGATEDTVKANVEKIKQNFQSTTGQTAQFRQISLILQEFKKSFNNTQCPSCPVRTTGSSPSLFVYGQKDTVLSIEPKMALTYSDPSVFEAKMWSIVIKNNRLKVNNLDREYIYYEYQPVKFDRPKDGWLIEKSQLEKLASEIVAKLGLNTKEKQRLIVELKLAATDVPDNLLFIGLIPQKEVNEKLPLSFSKPPEIVYRYHFFIDKAGDQQIKPPQITPIERREFMVVELGAVGE